MKWIWVSVKKPFFCCYFNIWNVLVSVYQLVHPIWPTSWIIKIVRFSLSSLFWFKFFTNFLLYLKYFYPPPPPHTFFWLNLELKMSVYFQFVCRNCKICVCFFLSKILYKILYMRFSETHEYELLIGKVLVPLSLNTMSDIPNG